MKNYETLARANEEVVRQLYAAFQSSDVDGVIKHLSADLILTIPGKGMNAGEYWGHKGFKKFFSNIMNYNGGLFTNELDAFAAGDKHVFVRELNVLNRKEEPSEDWQLPMVMLYTLRNGKISQIRVIPEYPEVYDAYWTPGATNPAKSENLFEDSRYPLGDAVSIKQYDFLMEKYFGFWDGNFDGFKKVMGDDLVFFLTGNSALAGAYKGYNGYLEFRSKLVGVTGDKYQLMIEAFAASDTDVFVLEHLYQNTIYQDKPGDMYVVMHFIIKDGMIKRANDFPLDATAYEKFYGKSQKKQETKALVAG
jgi:ketosteroid isomerase-like protein